MVEPIPGIADNVLAFSAKGKVTSHDYETVIIPAVEKILAEHDKIRLLYHIGPDFEGFEAGAMWDDARVGLRHLTSWERIAMVTDVEWLRAMMKAFGFVMPGMVKVFNNDDLEDAIEWITSKGVG